jgi:hypothetical protein
MTSAASAFRDKRMVGLQQRGVTLIAAYLDESPMAYGARPC